MEFEWEQATSREAATTQRSDLSEPTRSKTHTARTGPFLHNKVFHMQQTTQKHVAPDQISFKLAMIPTQTVPLPHHPRAKRCTDHRNSDSHGSTNAASINVGTKTAYSANGERGAVRQRRWIEMAWGSERV